MSSDTVIRVDNLSKHYVLQHRDQPSEGFRHVLQEAFRKPFRALRPNRTVLSQARQSPEQSKDEFWALRNVSFEVKRGDVVGIIGRNGAGKSTLLKVLSRIVEPSGGRVEINGRIASLLEVGTGFHPELTGRENIFLNGAILGMSRAEVKSKFDEIVAFAEIERFLDTPVKRYSSGMYVRLAFAVAAHLDPEILIVDEVLAVGDAQFQQKCLGKMGDIASRSGRTVLFVSHSMAAINALCQRGICLEKGGVAADTTSAGAVEVYLKGFDRPVSHDLLKVQDRSGKGEIRLSSVEICSPEGQVIAGVSTGKPVRFVFQLTSIPPKLALNFLINDSKGNHVAILNTEIPSPHDREDASIGNKLICDIEKLPLLPGRYRIQVNLKSDGEHQDGLETAAVFEVEDGEIEGRRESATPYGVVAIPHRWTLPRH